MLEHQTGLRGRNNKGMIVNVRQNRRLCTSNQNYLGYGKRLDDAKPTIGLKGCTCQDSKNYVQQPNYKGYGQPLMAEEMDSNFIRVLLDENQNLRGQNKCLQRELGKYISRAKEVAETMLEYQNIMSVLNAQNARLHKEILSLSDNANHKVERLKTTIDQFLRSNKANSGEHYQDQDLLSRATDSDQQHEYPQMLRRNCSQKRFLKRQQPYSIRQPRPRIAGQNQECAFQTLLAQCRNEQNPSVRKDMRKRLVQLTYGRSALC